MKHLLIILSLLLLSSPVIGDNHKGGTLYLWDTSSGKEWKYFGSWKNGEIWNGTEYDNYGNIIGKWVNGVRQ